MRKRYRLHLLDLLDLRSSPTVLPSLLSTPVETMASPSETFYVGLEPTTCSLSRILPNRSTQLS
jgi:hypothetical protein